MEPVAEPLRLAPPRRRGRRRLTRAIGACAVAAALGAGAAPALPTEDADEPRRDACPYDFRSPMPQGEFCVYRGEILSTGGEICAADSVVIWSTYPQAALPEVVEPAPAHDVYFGFANEPALVIHAVARTRWQARLTAYTLATSELAVPLDGYSTLGGHRGPGALTMSLRLPLASRRDERGCDFAAYRGVFIGIMRGPDPGVPTPN